MKAKFQNVLEKPGVFSVLLEKIKGILGALKPFSILFYGAWEPWTFLKYKFLIRKKLSILKDISER